MNVLMGSVESAARKSRVQSGSQPALELLPGTGTLITASMHTGLIFFFTVSDGLQALTKWESQSILSKQGRLCSEKKMITASCSVFG
jgi:hypothetical protein